MHNSVKVDHVAEKLQQLLYSKPIMLTQALCDI